MPGLTVTSAPAAEPVTLGQAKDHLRVDHASDDTLISDLIAVARQRGEDYTGRAFVTQTLRLSLDAWPGEQEEHLWEGTRLGPDLTFAAREILLPRPPLQSVSSVVTFDDDDVSSTFDSDNYFVDTDGEPGRVVLRRGQSWPTALRVGNAIQITYVAGYSDAGGSPTVDGLRENVPAAIKRAVLADVAHLYENRGDMDEPNPSAIARAIYQPYRVLRLNATMGA